MRLGVDQRCADLLLYPAQYSVHILAEEGALALLDVAAAILAINPGLSALGVNRVDPGPHAQGRDGAVEKSRYSPHASAGLRVVNPDGEDGRVCLGRVLSDTAGGGI